MGRPLTDEPDEVVMGRLFAEAEIPCAAVLDVDGASGCLLLEDLGERTVASLLGRLATRTDAEEIESLYRKAVRLAADIADRGTKVLRRSPRSAGPVRDAAQFRKGSSDFVEHYVRGVAGHSSLPEGFESSLHDLAEQAAASPRVLCHGAFRAAEIVVRRDGSLALPDVSVARWGPDTYDLACLVRDPALEIEDDLVVSLVEAYRWNLPEPPEPTAFRGRFQVMSAQVLIEDLGSAAKCLTRGGDPSTHGAIRRGLARLARVLRAIPAHETLARNLEDKGLFRSPPVGPPAPEQG